MMIGVLNMLEKKTRMDYKWVILILCFLMEFVCMGFCSSNSGLYTKAVTEALDIKRSIYSLSTSIRYGVQVLVALNFGAIIKRLGVRKMVAIGMGSLIASALIRASATSVYHIYAGCALWGVGVVFAGGTMAGTIVRRWFHQNVGRYTGIVMSANGLGGALAAQIVSPLINNGEVFGYRKAYLLAAAVAFAMGVIVVSFLREKPADSTAEDVPGKKKNRGTLWEGIPYDTLKKKPYFYFTAVLVFISGISIHAAGNVSIVYMGDLGMAPAFVAVIATITSLGMTCSKILLGLLYDKKGLRTTLLLCLSAAVLSFFLEAILRNSAAGRVMAVAAIILESFAIAMETVMIPLISNDLFGSASYDKVLGVFTAMNALGLCLGSPLGDLCYDIFGTYRPCFWFFTVILLVVAVAYLFVIRAAYRDKNAILAAK